MKIAILSCFHPYRGGISQFNASLYQELSRTHTVAAFNFKRQYPNFLFPGKTQFVTAEDEAVAIANTPLLDTANPFSYQQTARRIREWQPDLLLMRYWMSYFAPSQGWVARHLGPHCKVISIVDNVIPHEPHFFDKPLTRWYLKGNDAFVTLCEAVNQDLKDLYPTARTIVSPHPLYAHFGQRMDATQARQQLGIDPDKRTLLFFGLIRDYKGLDILLEALSQLDDRYQLIIAGEPYGSYDKYEKIIRERNLQSRIHTCLEYIPDGRVSPYFSAADVCVLPYRSATQSGISSVSYHFEVPLITTDVGGLRETVADRNTGLVVPPSQPQAIAQAIERYFDDPNLRPQLVEGIRLEKERLSWSRFCENLINLYHTL